MLNRAKWCNKFALPFILFFLFYTINFSIAKETERSPDLKKWHSHIETLGQFGSSRVIGLTDLFLIIKQKPDSIFFVDLRAQKDDNNSNEYNAGLAYRKLFKNSILGTYLYYDRRKSSYNNIFHQVTIGGERLGKNWDLRFNGYLPQDKESDIEANAFIENHKLKVSYITEKPLKGIDFEVGRKLPLGNTRSYLGYYYFAKDNDKGFIYNKKSGTTARIETKFFNDFLTIGGKLTYNQNSTWDEIAYLRVRIPLNFSKRKKLTDLESRMTDTIIRDIDIVTDQHIETTDNVTLDINNISPNSVNIVDLSTVDDIDDTIESYGDDSLVILTNSGTLNDEIDLAQGQVIIAGNSNLSLNYTTSRGKTYSTNYNPNLASATLNSEDDISDYNCSTGIGGSDCLILVNNSNTAIKGINIIGSEDDAIYITGDNLSNINLIDLNISNNSDDAIYIHNTNNSDININNLSVNNIDDDAIYISNADNNTISISNSRISNITNDGIDITSGSNNNTIDIHNTTFSNITAIPINNKDSDNSNIINID